MGPTGPQAESTAGVGRVTHTPYTSQERHTQSWPVYTPPEARQRCHAPGQA